MNYSNFDSEKKERKMITFMEPKENSEDSGKCMDSQLWHACAGTMVQMPTVNSEVFYFPQGHSEHASETVDFRSLGRVPPYVPCRVSGIRFMADADTDEVFAKIRLVPVSGTVMDANSNDGPVGTENREKPASFAKTLTQSDANNGGGFSVPRYCAETIFPRLDYSSEPPVQTVLAKDVQGKTWKFRHIYRGTPRRHLLTTGWSTFVNHKKLVAGDSIVFIRAENGDLRVGIRRAKRGFGGGTEMQMGWNYVGFVRDAEVSKLTRNGSGGRVRGEDVTEAARLAASGQAFEVFFYPRASTPEFCVRADLVRAAMRIRWSSGMRFKMAFETEDSSRVSWFMGTVSSAQVADPIQWPDSPWSLLQVAWDEPDLLQNVKRVSPWLVELVSNMPAIHFSPFSSPRKKLRLPNTQEIPLDGGQIPLPSLLGNPFGFNPNNSNPAGMQGARHGQYGLSSLSSLFPASFLPPGPITPKPSCSENVSCQLKMGSPIQSRGPDKSDNGKAAPFMLFGQKILTERQISLSCSSDNTVNSSSDGSGAGHIPSAATEAFQSVGTGGQCKVFMESEDVGRTMDLSLMGCYEEMYGKLADMFGVEVSEIANRVLYRDSTGAVKRVGDKLFGEFTKMARRLTILGDSSSDHVGSIEL